MKIYTRTGDHLETQIKTGRVYKDDIYVEASGTLDEAITSIMLAASKSDDDVKCYLKKIAKKMLEIGSDFSGYKPNTISEDDVLELEKQIDLYQAKLKPINDFILPGEIFCSCLIHQARVVVRRLERRLVTIAKVDPINQNVLAYVNRLSDLLYVIARSEEND